MRQKVVQLASAEAAFVTDKNVEEKLRNFSEDVVEKQQERVEYHARYRGRWLKAERTKQSLAKTSEYFSGMDLSVRLIIGHHTVLIHDTT